MSELEEILKYLEYIRLQNRSVSLISTYQGVSISLEVNIEQVSKRPMEIVVSVSYGRNISLLPATTILIHSDLFPHPIQASVASVDVHRRQAVLKSFLYSMHKDESRKETRFQPQEKLSARITLQGHPELTGDISDISIEGISLTLMDQTRELERIFRPKTSVRLFVDLPASKQQDQIMFSYRATVTYVNLVDSAGEYRLGFMTYPSEQEKIIIRRYIFDRQTELFSKLGQNRPSKKNTSFVL